MYSKYPKKGELQSFDYYHMETDEYIIVFSSKSITMLKKEIG